MKPWVIACLLLASTSALPQAPDAEQRAKEIAAFCAKAYCRPARTVRVRLEDGSTFEKEVPRLPIVLPNGWITVFAGEQVHIELTADKGNLAARAVPKVANPKTTVSFRLVQTEGAAMRLAVSHNLPASLKYSLGLMLPTGSGLQASPSCAVAAGAVTNETWDYPVFQAVIVNLRFLPAGAALSCGP
jgi:hypothetical protein